MSFPVPIRKRIVQIDQGMDMHRIQDGSYYLEHMGRWIELGDDAHEAIRRAHAIISGIHSLDGVQIRGRSNG